MSFIFDLLKDIPLSAVLRERLTEAEKQMSAMQTQHETDQVQIRDLNVRLEQKDQEIKRLTDELEACRNSHNLPPGSWMSS